jgi:hypothetical protein
MTTTYQKLLNKIEAFCNAHLQIKKYKGEFKEQMPNFATLDEKYPIVFVVPNGDTEGLELNQFTLEVYCLDIIQKDRANINTIVSDCHLILKDLYLYFKDGTDLEVDVIGDPTMTPLNNDLLDYAAGWVMTITFEVEGYTVCAIPMNPIPPFTPICEDADYQITDTDDNILYSGTIPSGGSLNQTIADSTATLKDTADNVLSTTQILAEGSEDITAPDATYTVEYLNGTPIQSGNILSGGFELIVVPNPTTCADAVVNVNSVFFDNVASGGTLNIQVRKSSGSDLVGSKQGQYWRIGDSTAVLKTSGGATISTTSIKAEESEDITAPDTDIEVNGVSEGSVVAGSTVDIQLSDSLGVVTPISVTQTGNDFSVVLPDAPPAPVGATLMKTGQQTSFRTGDDGDIEAGRATDFFTLASNNPFGSTARFTDELGGSTYTNNWVIDWSTYNGVNVLGYYRVVQTSIIWNTAIDNALGTFGTFSGCRMPNNTELLNLFNYGAATTRLNYSPFNLSTTYSLWASTTVPTNTATAFRWGTGAPTLLSTNKTSALGDYIPVRTFTVTGTTLT